MNRLDRIKAALEAKREALTMLRAELDYRDFPRRIRARDAAQDNLHDLLTDDTIAALVAVAEAAAKCEERNRDVLLGVSSEQLRAALAPLVKEADHDHA